MDARAGDVDPLSTADAMLCEGHLTYLAARLPSQGDVERESDDRTVVVARDVRCRGADRSRRRSAGSSVSVRVSRRRADRNARTADGGEEAGLTIPPIAAGEPERGSTDASLAPQAIPTLRPASEAPLNDDGTECPEARRAPADWVGSSCARNRKLRTENVRGGSGESSPTRFRNFRTPSNPPSPIAAGPSHETSRGFGGKRAGGAPESCLRGGNVKEPYGAGWVRSECRFDDSLSLWVFLEGGYRLKPSSARIHGLPPPEHLESLPSHPPPARGAIPSEQLQLGQQRQHEERKSHRRRVAKFRRIRFRRCLHILLRRGESARESPRTPFKVHPSDYEKRSLWRSEGASDGGSAGFPAVGAPSCGSLPGESTPPRASIVFSASSAPAVQKTKTYNANLAKTGPSRLAGGKKGRDDDSADEAREFVRFPQTLDVGRTNREHREAVASPGRGPPAVSEWSLSLASPLRFSASAPDVRDDDKGPRRIRIREDRKFIS
ncbi:hypothetical protein QR680_005566 [Steinernema hermaphroditum]|uniref:Uncharacterized protein n=1 Tax=Steinernema hermaphroditum TaxID=289476 RepID=A0AA39LVX1_9BILA|nr:hypothetical protein QR680_005566 [Steinernema hermaphroditum]